MRKTKILAITPYEGMGELLAGAARERTDVDLTIRTGNLAEGLKIAQTMALYENYDAIISRGGTAELIRKNLSIPVTEVPLSVYDILRSIKTAENSGEKFAITGFGGITENAKILCDLLQLPATIITFRSQAEVLPEMLELKKRQFTFVICDQISFMTARKIGLNAIVVPSGSESIRTALDDAVRSVTSMTQLNRQLELFKAALLNTEEITLLYNSGKTMIFSSLLGDPFETQIDSEIHASLSGLLDGGDLSVDWKIGGRQVRIHAHALTVSGERFTMLRVLQKNTLFSGEKNPVSVFNESLEPPSPDSGQANSANLIGSTHMLLEKYAPSSLPVLISGEKGTGKERAAHLLYRLGPYSARPYYVIDCSMLSDREVDILLNHDASPFAEINITIHLKEISALKEAQFLKLYAYIKDSELCKRNRMIFSILSSDTRAGKYQSCLADQMSCLLLAMTPLRERTNDISGMAAIYLNQLNAQIGKQIIGFQPDAFDLIRSYSWPNNLDQFRRVIKELAVITNTSYISSDDTAFILEQENKQYPPKKAGPGSPAINLKQPLEKITFEIINLVLAEENMNRERTANRLGISRSTLWRILKNQ